MPSIEGSAPGPIVAAAARLLREGGAAAVTTRAVAHEAGVQPPAIFRAFGDKDGLLDAVVEHVMTSYSAEKAARAAGESGDPVDDLRIAWRDHIEFGLTNPEVFLLLSAPGRRDRSPSTRAGIEVLESRVSRVAAAGRLRVPQQRAVAMIHAAGTGALLALIGLSPDERDPGLAEAMLDAVLGRILAIDPAPPAADRISQVIALHAAAPELPGLTDAERALLGEWLGRTIDALDQRG